MRRSLAAFAASVLLLSSLGKAAVGAEPESRTSPAPIVDPTPSAGPATIGEPGSTADPSPSADPTSDRPNDPGRRPDGSPTALVVEATNPSVTEPMKLHHARAATDPTDRWIIVLKPG